MQRNDILKLLFETPYEALRERADEVRAREKGGSMSLSEA